MKRHHRIALRCFAAALLAPPVWGADMLFKVEPLGRGERFFAPAVDAEPALPKIETGLLDETRPAIRELREIEKELAPRVRPVQRMAQVQILNGNRIIVNGGVVVFGDGGDGKEGKGEETNPATPHAIEFSDGSRLHGVLDSIDGVKKELVWRDADASAPIAFPLGQVSRMTFETKAKQDAKVHATVKLTGGDWLAADVVALQGGKLQLKLADGTPVAIDRARIEWVYLSKGAAPECYDGPTSFSGWTAAGGWVYREGALRSTQPSVIGRLFEQLPDQVEYRFEVDQGGSMRALAILLHAKEAAARGFGTGMTRLMLNDTSLQLWWQADDNMKQEQVDLTKFLRAGGDNGTAQAAKKKPMRWRVFEDRTAGRLIVFLDGRKAAEWNVAKKPPGENSGALTFQSMAYSSNTEQTISKIRVMPWDGFVPVDDAIDETRPKTDRIVLPGGESKDGHIETMTSDHVKLGTGRAALEFAREKIALVRFAKPENPPEEDPPVARVRLSQRGEFDVAAIGFHEGKMRMRTNFAGELALPAAAFSEVEFAHLAPPVGKQEDILVFKNGDQLRGRIESMTAGQKLRWRASAGAAPVEMDTTRMAGITLAQRDERPPVKGGVLLRSRTGDLLGGNLVALDKNSVVLDSSTAGRVEVPRARTQTMYFASNGQLPVLDGATDHGVWEAGLDFNRSSAAARKRKADAEAGRSPIPSPWFYFDGAFSFKKPAGSRSSAYNDGSTNLGRVIDSLPTRVEFSFDAIGRKSPVYFSSYLFSEPDNPGYMMQLHPGGIFIYDTGQQGRGRGLVQQQQIQFGDKVKADATSHHIRILADRLTGRLTIVVDDVVVGNFGPKIGAPARNLARGLALIAQQNMACTFANLWVAPWNGQVPGKAPAAGGDTPPDNVLFANGDEAQGTVVSATPEAVKLESEVGQLDLPLARLMTVEFGGATAEPHAGARLRLTDRSVLTVSSFHIENETVTCRSETAGELKIPLSAVQELIFAAPAVPKPAEKSGAIRGQSGVQIGGIFE
jgi:hypothetical protein